MKEKQITRLAVYPECNGCALAGAAINEATVSTHGVYDRLILACSPHRNYRGRLDHVQMGVIAVKDDERVYGRSIDVTKRCPGFPPNKKS
jgi:hypothetical protein